MSNTARVEAIFWRYFDLISSVYMLVCHFTSLNIQLRLNAAHARLMLAVNLSYVATRVLIFDKLLTLRHLDYFKVAWRTGTHVLGQYLTKRVLADILVVDAVVDYVDVVVYGLVAALAFEVNLLLRRKHPGCWLVS